MVKEAQRRFHESEEQYSNQHPAQKGGSITRLLRQAQGFAEALDDISQYEGT